MSGSVISARLSGRNCTSLTVCHTALQACILWCEDAGVPPLAFSVAQILAFFQYGVECKLALSTIRGQVSALAILFKCPLPHINTLLITQKSLVLLSYMKNICACPFGYELSLSALESCVLMIRLLDNQNRYFSSDFFSLCVLGIKVTSNSVVTVRIDFDENVKYRWDIEVNCDKQVCT